MLFCVRGILDRGLSASWNGNSGFQAFTSPFLIGQSRGQLWNTRWGRFLRELWIKMCSLLLPMIASESNQGKCFVCDLLPYPSFLSIERIIHSLEIRTTLGQGDLWKTARLLLKLLSANIYYFPYMKTECMLLFCLLCKIWETQFLPPTRLTTRSQADFAASLASGSNGKWG